MKNNILSNSTKENKTVKNYVSTLTNNMNVLKDGAITTASGRQFKLQSLVYMKEW